MQIRSTFHLLRRFFWPDTRKQGRKIAIGLIASYLLCFYIGPTYAYTGVLSLPSQGNLIGDGELYLNTANISPDWARPKPFLDQLVIADGVSLKGGDYWFRLSVTNTTSIEQWTIKVDGSFIEHIQAHLFDPALAVNGLGYPISSPKGGQFDPPGYLHHYGMDIHLQPNKQYDLWVNLHSRYYTAPPHIEIMPTTEFEHDVNGNNFLIIGCLGSIIILAIYNLLIYLWTQAKEYLYYSIYLISVFVAWAAVFGVFPQFFNNSSIALIMLPFYTSVIFNIFFYKHFLELPQTHPVMAKISNAIILLCLVAFCTYSFAPAWVNYACIVVINSLWLCTGLTCGIYRLYEGYKPARFFVLGFSIVFIGGALVILPYFGFPRIIKDGYLATLVCQTLDVLFLALALADRINNLQQEKQTALTLAHETGLEANRTLTEANNKLQEALVMAAKNQRQKDEFLVAVSHEFRTPLNAITVSLSQLNQTHDPREQKALRDYIQFGTERLASQVENIIVLAELDEKEICPQYSVFNLEELLLELEEMAHGYLIEKDLTFSINTSESVTGYYLGDKHLIVRLLAPIIDNACKYTKSGSISLQTSENWGNLTFEIIDTGPGIPADKKDIIFESFVQISSGFQRSHEGLGLGLTISKRITELLDGRIEFDAVIPHGCHCIVSIPARKQDPPHNINKRLIHSAHALIVEDNKVNAKVLQSLLAKLGVSSDIAEDGVVALNVTGNNNYDLIFMDLQMPTMDGFSATESIRLKGIKTPIIAITANTDYRSRKRCAEIGMDDFLAKPIKKSTLQQAINKWLS
ncbi:MAG: hypothetical protein COA99_04780 [Moraxellaceae bacterium]|nr:MAG: hypothetical protein COA99_04780 [Moraxellaceae bacterium]